MMPAERVAMRQVREIIRLKFSAGISTREIARRLGIPSRDPQNDNSSFGDLVSHPLGNDAD